MINQALLDKTRTHGTYLDTNEGRHKVLVNDIGFRMGEKAKYALIIGCAAPKNKPNVLKALKDLLDFMQINYTLLTKEYCCGWPTFIRPAVKANDEKEIAEGKKLSKEFITENFRQAETLGAESIVLFCPACEPHYSNVKSETGMEIISHVELIDRYFKSGKLELEADYYAGCFRFRKRVTTEPLDTGAAMRILNRIDGLRLNRLDSNLCCVVPHHLEQLTTSIKNQTVITPCSGCYTELRKKLQPEGKYKLRMLPEIVLDSMRANLRIVIG